MNKIKLWSDHDIYDNGVGRVWRWHCPECFGEGHEDNWYYEALYWDNAIRSVNWHIHQHAAAGSR